MGVREKFNQLVTEKKWWCKDERVLVAVSAGVDSVVLLHLLLRLPEEIRPEVHVAHVNHQLRDESKEEAEFVETLCNGLNIPFHKSVWRQGSRVTTNVELAAREYRYSFFSKVMREESIPILLTAHHEDDQVETMMMRLIKGGRLASLTGIEEKRNFFNGELIRPLLTLTKKELYHFATEESILFYEDETNYEMIYLRNRLRHELLPQMKVENPQLNEQLKNIQNELSHALRIVGDVVSPLYEESVYFYENKCQLDVNSYQSYSLSEQHFLLSRVVDECQHAFQLIIGKKQQELIHQLLLSESPNIEQKLKDNWYFSKEYHKAEIRKKENSLTQELVKKVKLNEGIFLSEHEWLGVFQEEYVNIPAEIKKWQSKEWPIQLDNNIDLLVRKRQPGDRFVMDNTGKRKKVSRYFIDEKIPQEERERSWIVEDNSGVVKCIVPFRESYLSIRDETDKIHYKLVYLYKKDE